MLKLLDIFEICYITQRLNLIQFTDQPKVTKKEHGKFTDKMT